MQKGSLFGLIAAVLVFGAAAVNHAMPRVENARSAAVPIDKLPRTIGEWRNAEDEAVDRRVQNILPTAKIIQRVYRDGQGHPVQALLETSPKASDYHPPTYCMSAQGWNILATKQVPVGNVSATLLEMRGSSGEECALLYWYAVDKNAEGWAAMAARMMSGRAPSRLFTRVLVSSDDGIQADDARAQQFAAQLAPQLTKLEAQ